MLKLTGHAPVSVCCTDSPLDPIMCCEMQQICLGHVSAVLLICNHVQAIAVALYNPEAFRTIGQARLDVGRVLPESMSDESYRELLVGFYRPAHCVLNAAASFVNLQLMLSNDNLICNAYNGALHVCLRV